MKFLSKTDHWLESLNKFLVILKTRRGLGLPWLCCLWMTESVNPKHGFYLPNPNHWFYYIQNIGFTEFNKLILLNSKHWFYWLQNMEKRREKRNKRKDAKDKKGIWQWLKSEKSADIGSWDQHMGCRSNITIILF